MWCLFYVTLIAIYTTRGSMCWTSCEAIQSLSLVSHICENQNPSVLVTYLIAWFSICSTHINSTNCLDEHWAEFCFRTQYADCRSLSDKEYRTSLFLFQRPLPNGSGATRLRFERKRAKAPGVPSPALRGPFLATPLLNLQVLRGARIHNIQCPVRAAHGAANKGPLKEYCQAGT